MIDNTPAELVSASSRGFDSESLGRLFTGDDLLPLWIAEPYLPIAEGITNALRERSSSDWFGYEVRSDQLIDGFTKWTQDRHQWDAAHLDFAVSPSIGTSIATLIDLITQPGEGVIIQPPVFTDFKPLITRSGREVVRSPLLLTGDRYEMHFADLEQKAALPDNTAMILCNPHNPVGRVWTPEELGEVARICAAHDIFVIADEIHADLALSPNRFTPFATVTAHDRYAVMHGPIKTFGLAGLCDTLVLGPDDVVAEFKSKSVRYHLTRNQNFGLVAFETAYRTAGQWVDDMLDLVKRNVDLLSDSLPEPLSLVPPEGTYLAWLDMRGLGLEVPELAKWINDAGLAFSPGHWFGRQGAGFARMTIAVPTPTIEEAVDRLSTAI